MTAKRLDLSRAKILGYRRNVQALDARLPAGAESLRRAAWAGLADSMPRAALLSIHARIGDTGPSTWEHPSLVQVWGPRFGDYVIAASDVAVFTLGRMPDDGPGRERATTTAARLHTFLDGARMPYGQAGRAMGVNPNSLRYATTTGTVLIRWEGARQPVIWTIPAPDIDPFEARLELARRYLHVFGVGTADSFANWAGIKPPRARAAFDGLAGSLAPVRTPVGDRWMLAANEDAFRAPPGRTAPARLLPSGDVYTLFWGADRELVMPDANQRAALWTSRVWPGAVLVSGEIVGTWRRDGSVVAIETWRRLEPQEQAAVEAEAMSFPLPDLRSPIRVAWAA